MDALDAVFDAAASVAPPAEQAGLALADAEDQTAVPPTQAVSVGAPSSTASVHEPDRGSQPLPTPAEAVFAAVRDSARRVLTTPTKDADFAEALGVSGPQAKVWLKRLLEEGVVEKQLKPPGYIVKQSNLFE